ncbi:MAG: hypothetical protein IKS21_01255 [Oscillospiraceae bacterium]|nr:hypothetical protein [Oscillospiraceae bacterium]
MTDAPFCAFQALTLILFDGCFDGSQHLFAAFVDCPAQFTNSIRRVERCDAVKGSRTERRLLTDSTADRCHEGGAFHSGIQECGLDFILSIAGQ